MSNGVFLSLATEQALLLGERIVFAISSLLNIAGLFCLICKSPSHQAKINNYLLVIQAIVILSDVCFCVLFEPFPLLQLFAGYCVGILCQILQPTTVAFGYYAICGAMGAAVIVCGGHRNQKIVTRGRWALSENGRSWFNRFMIVLLCGPSLACVAIPFDSAKSHQLIEHSIPDVRWMRDRGKSFMIERNLFSMVIVASIVFHLVFCIVIAVCVFGHVFIFLKGENGKGAKLKRSITISLIKVSVQIGAPILVMIFPMLLLVMDVIFECFSFDFCLYVTFIIPSHPIVHNLIMIGIVPEYRRYFGNILFFLLRKKTQQRMAFVRPAIRSSIGHKREIFEGSNMTN